jgi:dihydroorotase
VLFRSSQNPARVFNLRKGVLAPGYDADFLIVGEMREIRKEKLHSRAGWTPFGGMDGIFPKMTISRGEVVSQDGEIIGKRGRGRFIPGHGFVTKSENGE